MATASPTSVNCFSKSAGQWTCVLIGKEFLEGTPWILCSPCRTGSYTHCEQVHNDYAYQEKPLAAHTSSDAVFKSSVLLLHPNVAEEVKQEASMEDVQQC